MSPEQHKKRHLELHNCLDELVADMINQNDVVPSQITVMDLMEWSYKQTQNPTNKGEQNYGHRETFL